jgi:hypothetical protein
MTSSFPSRQIERILNLHLHQNVENLYDVVQGEASLPVKVSLEITDPKLRDGN